MIRHYHGHLSGVYCLELHPTLDVLFTGGRDSTIRVNLTCLPFQLSDSIRFGTFEPKLKYTCLVDIKTLLWTSRLVGLNHRLHSTVMGC